MADDEDRPVCFTAHFFKHFDQVGKTPEIDPCFRFIQNAELCVSGNELCDLDPL